jgi:D-alanyl-D-alanine carboxypeptidase
MRWKGMRQEPILFFSFMGYQPQKGATIVVLTNLQTAPDGSGSADELEKVIQKELFA